MNKWKIALIPGETVGPELIREADRLLDTVGRVYHIPMERIHLCAGGAAIDRWNDPLPAAVRARAASCDAILFGSIGAAKYNALPPEKNPARALLELRSVFGVTTNLRPVRLRPEQIDLSPLKPEIIPGGFDILLVRDVRGGMLAAREQRHAVGKCGQSASDLEYYDERIVMHTARRAFEAASQRTGRLISLDKANVLASSVLWRQTVTRLAAEYPKVALEHRFIDTAAMDVIRAPQDFDVILTGNVFGDILADELAQLSGIAPQLGSAELAPDGRGLYTLNQLHYPGENLAGQGKVCPLGILAATAMLLRYTCHRPDAAQAVEQAIDTVISAHLATPDICRKGDTILSTEELGCAVCQCIRSEKE